jgi:hypothetical protein
MGLVSFGSGIPLVRSIGIGRNAYSICEDSVDKKPSVVSNDYEILAARMQVAG